MYSQCSKTYKKKWGNTFMYPCEKKKKKKSGGAGKCRNKRSDVSYCIRNAVKGNCNPKKNR